MRMCRQGKKVLLFVDNAPSHPQLNLKNVHLLPKLLTKGLFRL